MTSKTIGLQFRGYQHYCDVVDEALAAFHSPLMNGLPSAKFVRRLIQNKRLFFVQNQDHVLIFSAHDGYYKLYYAAQETAALVLPPADAPVVVDQVRLETKRYPLYDALMKKSGFTLGRVNIGMARKLDDSLKKEQYVQADVPDDIAVDLAVPGELYKIDDLLRTVFDPLLDELPSKEELGEMIASGHVFVIRIHEKIAATMIRIPKGAVAMMHWVAVDRRYRNLKLSGLIGFAGDEDSRKKASTRSLSGWTRGPADGSGPSNGAGTT